MMKKILCSIMLLGIISGCTVSKRTLFLEIPHHILTEDYTIDLPAYEEKYSDYGGVFLSYEKKYEYSGVKQDIGLGTQMTYTMLVASKFLVLDNESPYATSLRLWYKPDKFYIKTTAPDGTVNNFRLLDLKVEVDAAGDKAYVFIYPSIEKGTVIQIGYETTFSISPRYAKTDYDIPLQFSIPCEKYEFAFAYPDWWDIDVKSLGPDRNILYDIEYDGENKKQTMVYRGYNIPAIADEPYSPEFKQMANYLQFMITNFQMGDSKMARPDDWDDLAELIYKDLLKKINKKSTSIDKADRKYNNRHFNNLDEFVKNLFAIDEPKSDMEKIQSIVDYIQNEIRITHRNKKGNVSRIINDREGTAFDVTSLAKNMLNSAGFDTEFLLVHSADDGYFDISYISFDQLYLPAIKISLNGNMMVIFPYMKFLPINLIPKTFQGQKALIIKGKNDFQFWETPVGSLSENSLTDDYQLSIAANGKINVIETKTFKGYLAYVTRVLLSDLEDDDRDKLIRKLLTYTDGDIGDLNYKVTNLENRYEELIIELEYSIDNLVTITPEEILFQTSGLLSSITNSDYKFDSEHRTNPIEIFIEEANFNNINITFPKHWQLATEFKDSTYENIFGSIKNVYTYEPGQLIINQHQKLNQTFQPKDTYQEFLKLYGKQNILNVPMLIFSVKPENTLPNQE